MVVELTPLLDQQPGLAKIPKSLLIQAFIAELSVEALHEAVVPRFAWWNECRADPAIAKPTHDSPGSELGSLVGTNVGGLAVKMHQSGEHKNHILARNRACYIDRQALARVLVEHAQKPKRLAIGKAVMLSCTQSVSD